MQIHADADTCIHRYVQIQKNTANTEKYSKYSSMQTYAESANTEAGRYMPMHYTHAIVAEVGNVRHKTVP